MIDKVDTSHAAVKKTGKAFLIAFPIIAAVIFLMHAHVSGGGWTGWDWAEGFKAFWWKVFLPLGVLLYALSHFAYPIMKPIHIVWMKFAMFLGWLNTRILLGLFFYLVLTPIGLLMRLFGKDLLDEKIDKSATSYWKKRDLSKFDPKHAARTF